MGELVDRKADERSSIDRRPRSLGRLAEDANDRSSPNRVVFSPSPFSVVYRLGSFGKRRRGCICGGTGVGEWGRVYVEFISWIFPSFATSSLLSMSS